MRFMLREAVGDVGTLMQAGYSRVLAELLIRRGCKAADDAHAFLAPCARDMHDPFALSDMNAAVEVILAAQRAGTKTVVYGDYDVDGVCACTILWEYFRSIGIPTDRYIPNRFLEGYGLNDAAAQKLAGAGYKLLVSVDCGATSVNTVRLAQELGMRCVITDHHQLSGTLPDCPVVNPVRAEYPNALCGTGVALKLVEALGGDLSPFMDIAALATIADIVPLLGENRYIVTKGLPALQNSSRTGITALCEVAKIAQSEISAGHVAFQLAPRLNAGGRLTDARAAAELLATKDTARARELALFLENENLQRRRLESHILRQAEEMIPDILSKGVDKVIILRGEDWNPGVIGIAASRLVEKHSLPTVLMSASGDEYVGSCRSLPTVNIHELLSGVADKMIKFGGHRMAAGVTVSRAEYDAFYEALREHARQVVPDEAIMPTAYYDLDTTLDALTQPLVESLDALQPTGCANPVPIFRVKAHAGQTRTVGADGRHLQLRLNQGELSIAAIAFSRGDMASKWSDRTLDVLFTPQVEEYRGVRSVKAHIKQVNLCT